MPDLISIAAARERVLAAVRPLPAEPVALDSALDRVLAEDVSSAEDLPPFDSSAMDGFAVIAGPAAELAVVAESRAGHPAERALAAGEAIRISTGAVIPDGADAVVPVERVEADGGRVRVPATRPGAHVRGTGEDVRAGDLVLRAGRPIGPAELGVLASLGRAEVRCARAPVVALLATGDELVEPGLPLAPGQIRNSNSRALAAQALRAGAAAVTRRAAADDRAAVEAALAELLESADVVCVSGGVSVGEHDHVKRALAALGVEQRFWGIRLKPGKPTWFGERDRKLVFGLPGNPVSSMVTFQLFARPALRALQGADPDAPRASALLDAPVSMDPERDQALRCALTAAEDGWHAAPARAQGSHVLTSMLGADALALVPAGDGELPAGTRVHIELLRAG